VLAAVATGCGGTHEVAQPTPSQPISAAMTDLNNAIAKRNCDAQARLHFSERRTVTTPGAAATRQECTGRFRAGLHFDKSAAYGTAALIEGPLPPWQFPGKTVARRKHAISLAVFVLDRDRRFRLWDTVIPQDRQIGTKPSAAAEDHARDARAVIAAIRASDCGALAALMHPASEMVTNYRGDRRAAACRNIIHGRIFAPAVRASPAAEPRLLGATRDFHFYGVATKRTYFTMVMETPPGTSDKPPLLDDVLANTSNPALR